MARAGSYVSGLVPDSGSDPSGLAVVPVGGDRAAAAVVVAAALARAREGAQVIVADLCPGAPAARLLGVRGAGVKMASGQEGQLAVVVPEPGEIAPAGPAVRPGPGVRLVLAREVYQAADVLLALVPLDPLGGSEHLASWAGRAVAVVTAGEASATRINAVGELISVAGVTQLPAVLLGVDKNDETVGAARLAVRRPARPDLARTGPDRPASDQNGDRPRADRPASDRPASDRNGDRPGPGRPAKGRPEAEGSGSDRPWIRPAGAGESRGGDDGPMSVTTTLVRPRKPPAPADVAAVRERSTRRRVGIIWGLLILNVLTFYPKTWSGQPLLVPIPSVVGKLHRPRAALPVALLLALTVNRRLAHPPQRVHVPGQPARRRGLS